MAGSLIQEILDQVETVYSQQVEELDTKNFKEAKFQQFDVPTVKYLHEKETLSIKFNQKIMPLDEEELKELSTKYLELFSQSAIDDSVAQGIYEDKSSDIRRLCEDQECPPLDGTKGPEFSYNPENENEASSSLQFKWHFADITEDEI